ncbi:MAG TPA: metal-sensitive transcriptional regulator [Acidimicrobiales bacterium]|nr:metal-sensitive transcriptional regulator [Acidimicrobiales bacterium]
MSPTKPAGIDLPEEVVEDLRRRLRRVGGQIAGIERMLEEGRQCRDVLTQISAANRALEQTGFKLISAGLTYCLSNPEDAEAAGYPLQEVERLFLKLA